ncbi:MarR family winged helix-turn-helix transcriptional regulator [Maritimibacter sp. DP1N21-5]|uniref:MarR family winged helix-turn-helix transcriptional regulator n=1 Tax=Maritimibacter sp. DP1N21-5 TaxID=2836867 RepID=UPI001C4614D8|nr:MarR family winged helix-turn-helix transcriptional regulator [Maritimibacter sp. DP1N21-5]MBV7407861.1 MarR family winged helix-turn-helix transcriptional regulator [Maritimibacter sp. DP1N21-5]
MTRETHRSTKDREGETILDLETYVPFLLSVAAAAWTRTTSAEYRAHFGLGITDWRVISMLNIEPKITANRICQVIHMDKAAVSRALHTLSEAGIVAFDAPKQNPRNRTWWLTDKGRGLHADILGVALEHEAKMMAGVAGEDLDTFLSVLRRMHVNLSAKS